MRIRIVRSALLSIAVTLLACRADLTGLQTLSVDELVALRAAHPELVVCDANNDDTRSKLGVIPGAVLLTDYKDYATSELPGDPSQRVVFYCHSEMCSAAGDAARTAVAAGYEDVWVLEPGIEGWVASGRPVDRPR